MEADRLLTFRRGVVEMGEGEGARLAGGRGVEGRRERRVAGWAEVTTEAVFKSLYKWHHLEQCWRAPCQSSFAPPRRWSPGTGELQLLLAANSS